MALEGTIKDFGLPDIFQLIGLQRKTGLLTLTNEKESVTVTFENGMVVMADSSSKRLEDRLGSVLVKQGKLSRERLEEALQVQKQTLQRLGHVLATNSYITAKDLKDALQVQVSHIVFKVFRWRDGNYNFAPTDNVDYDRENFNPMSADFILMEGIRMVDEWPIIEKKIPSMDIVFRSAVDPSLIEVGAARAEETPPAAAAAGNRTPASSSNKIRLSPEEERLYRKVDGTRSVQAIIDASGAPEFEVCRTLFDLLNRNIIAKAGTGAARAAEEEEVTGTVGSGIPGFVVLALVAFLSLAGIGAQLRSPFAVTGLPPLLGGSSDELLEGVSLSRLQRLDRALVAYHLIHGATPRVLDDLVASGLLDESGLQDPWSRPYYYAPGPSGYLISAVDTSGRPRRTASIERVLAVERP